MIYRILLIVSFGFLGLNLNAQMFTNTSYEDVVSEAKSEKLPYFIDFTADWCLPCKLMDETVFMDRDVINYANNNYVPLQLDMDDFDAMILKSKYEINQLPTILFFNYKGELIGRLEGLQTGTKFLQELKDYYYIANGV